MSLISPSAQLRALIKLAIVLEVDQRVNGRYRLTNEVDNVVAYYNPTLIAVIDRSNPNTIRELWNPQKVILGAGLVYELTWEIVVKDLIPIYPALGQAQGLYSDMYLATRRLEQTNEEGSQLLGVLTRCIEI